MYQNSIQELPRLKDERIENIFTVNLDENSRYFYNLLETINFPKDLPDGLFTLYTVQPNDTLPVISYKLFQTIHLWWVITICNDIINPVEKLEPGTNLKILNPNTIRLLIEEINK